MKPSALIRTGSIGPVPSPAAASAPRIRLHFDANLRRDTNSNSNNNNNIRRALSESNILRSGSGFSANKSRYVSSGGVAGSGIIPEEDMMRFSGGGTKTVTIEREERRKVGEYYQEMLKSNPSDALLLRNYGQFLHEVEKDMVRAEEYYCRAILASPGDGELLSLYGKLIWESQSDKDRAKSYYNQAVSASPDNSMVLGSFASFMWDAEEDDDNEEFDGNSTTNQVSSAVQLVPAF